MARKQQGETPRERHVGFRLDKADSEMLDRKSALRGLNVTSYFVTLMKEDAGAQSRTP